MRIATLLISTIILIALLYPGNSLPGVRIGNWDKVIHLVMFTVWAVAIRYDYRPKRFSLIRMLAIGIPFALATEVLQTLVEGRSFDIYDLLADVAGICLGWVVAPPLVGWVDRLLSGIGRRS